MFINFFIFLFFILNQNHIFPSKLHRNEILKSNQTNSNDQYNLLSLPSTSHLLIEILFLQKFLLFFQI